MSMLISHKFSLNANDITTIKSFYNNKVINLLKGRNILDIYTNIDVASPKKRKKIFRT